MDTKRVIWPFTIFLLYLPFRFPGISSYYIVFSEKWAGATIGHMKTIVRSLEHVFKVHRNHENFKIRFGKFRHPRGVQGQSRDGHEDMHQPNPSHSLPSSIWAPSLRFSFTKWCLEAIMSPKPGNSSISTHQDGCKFTNIISNS